MAKQTSNKHIGKLLIVFIVFVSAFWAGFTWWHMSLYAPGPLKTPKTIIIESGKSSQAIAQQLEKEGIVDDAFMFRIALRTSLSDRFLKAGEYAFEPKVSMRKVIQKLTGGDVLNRSLTIPEGYSFTQIRELLMAEEGLSGPPLAFEEGALLAETYHFKYGTKRAELMRKMAKEMNAVVDEAWTNRAPNLPLNSPQELLTLASIVEKETAIPSERTVIASVFINRLNKGMRLQADPTVIYGASDYAGDITYGHLRENHAYNTYVHKGLPPTPIASPGKEAIFASANPAQTDYLYFVADGTGKHIFAKTYAEHRENVAAYLATKSD